MGSISLSPSVPIGYGHRYWVIARAATSTTFNGWNWSYYGEHDVCVLPGRHDVDEHDQQHQLVRRRRLLEALQGVAEPTM